MDGTRYLKTGSDSVLGFSDNPSGSLGERVGRMGLQQCRQQVIRAGTVRSEGTREMSQNRM